jgi:hypothetical protein
MKTELIELRCRTWYKGLFPKRIKLKIPGWAGESANHSSGNPPQPWHCPPFVEGSTYGLELIYPYDTECIVRNNNETAFFDGDFDKEKPIDITRWPPFESFAPGFYGFTSSLDIKVPANYVIRLESHPKYYTDKTYTTPCVVPGHIQTEWWTRIFFIVFKVPPPNGIHVFKKREPYAQILILPKTVKYQIKEMSDGEKRERNLLENKIHEAEHYLGKNKWIDNSGHAFNDKYKVLSGIFSKSGIEGVKNYIDNALLQKETIQNKNKKKIKPIFVPVHYEKLQNKD